MRKTIQELEELVENGNVDAMQELGLRYYKGIGVETDYTKARNYFEKASKEDCKISSYYLGLIYYNGKGTNINHVKAKQYFEKSASDNNVFSTYYLGKIYYWGDGVEKNEAKAKEYKEKVLNNPFFANQNVGINEFYSLADIETESRNYASKMKYKIQTEFQNLYGKTFSI